MTIAMHTSNESTPVPLGHSVYLVGGRQDRPRALLAADGGKEYGQAVVYEVSATTGEVQCRFEYEPAPDPAAGDTPVVFKSGVLAGDRLYLCAPSEVLVLRFPTLERVGYLSLPAFNDLHHALPLPDGRLLLANSGMEMVTELAPDGGIARSWSTLADAPEQVAPPAGKDYRPLDLKPHRSHPNHVFTLGDAIWATRFHQKDAVCVTAPGRRIAIGLERVHDGVPWGGLVYFTTVDGKLVVANPDTLAIEEVVEFSRMHDDGVLLGWCRGLAFHGQYLWVGYSRLRPTKWRENVGWAARGFKRVSPTHVACYDLAERRRVADINVEDAGLNAIFSIFLAPSMAGTGG